MRPSGFPALLRVSNPTVRPSAPSVPASHYLSDLDLWRRPVRPCSTTLSRWHPRGVRRLRPVSPAFAVMKGEPPPSRRGARYQRAIPRPNPWSGVAILRPWTPDLSRPGIQRGIPPCGLARRTIPFTDAPVKPNFCQHLSDRSVSDRKLCGSPPRRGIGPLRNPRQGPGEEPRKAARPPRGEERRSGFPVESGTRREGRAAPDPALGDPGLLATYT